MFMRLSISTIHVFNHTKCVLLSNQKCMTQPTVINLLPNESRISLLSVCS